MKHLTYIIGEPAAGKSTLVAELTRNAMSYVRRQPFGMTVWETLGAPDVYELGLRRGDFSGTDALALNVQPRVIEWLREDSPEFVLGEGDRLANAKFFNAAKQLGYELRVVFLQIEEEEALRRRLLRALQLRRPEQDHKWVQGRRTKVANLAEQFATVTLDAMSEPHVMVEALLDDPVVATLLGLEVPCSQNSG